MDLIEAAEYHRHTLERLNRSPQTLRLYRIYQDSYLSFLIEQEIQLTLDALNPQFVREWQSWLRAKSTGRRGGVVTEKQGVMVLKTWGHFLYENDLCAIDPLGRLKIPRVQKIQRKPFTQDEATRLVQAAAAGPNPIRDRALLLLLFDTGCRVGELCAATVRDVDLLEGAITFTRTKNGHPRTVKFIVQNRRDGGSCLASLKNWLKVREAQPGVEALFTTRERWPLSTRRVRELFSEFGQAGRVPNAHPHRARNTAASEFLASQPGAELALRSRLGHLSKEVLADYVSQTDPAATAAATTASLSTKWHLGSGTNGAVHDSPKHQATHAPARRNGATPPPQPTPTDMDMLANLAAMLEANPAMRSLLRNLLGNQP